MHRTRKHIFCSSKPFIYIGETVNTDQERRLLSPLALSPELCTVPRLMPGEDPVKFTFYFQTNPLEDKI